MRRIAAALTAATLVLFAAACSDDEGDSTTTTEATGSSDSTDSSEFAAEIEERGEPTVEAVEVPVAELEIIDDVEGTGAEATPDSTVTAQYVGIVAETGEVFQSSWQMGGAIDFPLSGVIPGWSEGLVGMKEGGRRTLVIPAAMAYADSPPPGSGIPANADLVFTVDLVAVS